MKPCKALYVHIPFCNHICSYCDFCKVYYNETLADDYLNALAYEIKDKQLSGDYETIYIGGGTPSSLSFSQLECLFKLLEPFSSKVKEYTIEVNPESMDEDKIDLFNQYHINRVSIGVQTFHDSILKRIERYHNATQAIDLIRELSKKGIDDINVDLMYGLPGQTINDVYEDISIISRLHVSHVSVYSLILEDHTLLKNQHYQPLDDEQDAFFYDSINDDLEKQGYQHYEVSNYYYKKPSLHNLTYWHYQNYEGIGLGAHSLKDHHYVENTRSITKYLKHQYLLKDTKLSHDDELFEKIMMGLRLTEGINIKEIEKTYAIDFYHYYNEPITKYKKLKMLEISDGYLRTTALGMKFLNTILVDFLM